MVNLSKSKYCALWQCPKMLWLRKYKPELAEVDSHTLSIMETGKLPRVKSIEVLKEEEVWSHLFLLLHIRAVNATPDSQRPTLPPAKQGISVFRGNMVVTAAELPRSDCREIEL